MPTRYKVFLQPNFGQSLLDSSSYSFIQNLSDSLKRGIHRGFQVLTSDDKMSGQRLQILPYFINAPEPQLNTRLFQINPPLLPGTFVLQEPVSPLSVLVPEQYRHDPYNYYVLMKPDGLYYYLIIVQDLEEIDGIYTIMDWLGFDDRVIVRIEDLSGNLLLSR